MKKNHFNVGVLFFICLITLPNFTTKLLAQYNSSKFEQLGTTLPTPNNYRTADGSPGHEYWQQKADYKIKVSLNDEKQEITGSETITYYNYSPNPISYLWLQLDQNLFDKNSNTYQTMAFNFDGKSMRGMQGFVAGVNSPHGFKIGAIVDAKGNKLNYTINKTMMRIDLTEPLKAKTGKFVFSIDWSFLITDSNKMGGRSGFEYFPEDKNYLYEIAQWFPRMCVYNDVYGWQHKQFLGQGEFALTFGDYEVAITVPSDHIVASTGELQNTAQILTSAQQQRWKQAETAKEPVVIVTQDEAIAAEKTRSTSTKTWIYKAKDVRDFAWASSRKFIWDAMQVQVGGKKVWAMSYYPKEGNPLWGAKSTHSVAITLEVYSKYTTNYPYPVAISVHGPVFGMEYPMICFNGGRPVVGGTVEQNDRVKYAMISVIIHEVGHNYFPMIINSDERQWSWMDEGLNSFCQYLTELEIAGKPWAKDVANPYPSRRGPVANIVSYMKGAPNTLVPIMTNSEQILQFGNNAYGKPATALVVLRNSVMGKELFDFAFKQYSEKWKFKHPEPADFFRTMEDASGVDLDWFWRGWFYGTEPCDISLEDVTHYRLPKIASDTAKTANPTFTSKIVAKADIDRMFENLEKAGSKVFEGERKMLAPGANFYNLKLKNVGGLLMPVIVKIKFKDGTEKTERYPAEIWRMNPVEINKLIITDKEVASFSLDPQLETADINQENNAFPREKKETKFEEIKK